MKTFKVVISVASLFIISSLGVFAQETQPLSLNDIKKTLKKSISEQKQNCLDTKVKKINESLINQIRERMIDFTVTSEDKSDLKKFCADESLITEISFQSSKNYALEALLYLIKDNVDENDEKKAISSITKAIELYNTGEYYFCRGFIQSEIGNYKKAIDDFISAKTLNFKGAYTYNELGLAYFYDGQFSEAETNFNEAIKIDKSFAEAFYNLSRLYYQQRNYLKAVETVKKAVELNPDYGQAYSGLGILYQEAQLFELAIENYKKAIEAKYNRGWVYDRLGFIYLITDITQKGLS